MQATTLEGIFTHPAFICIFLTILISIANILVGVSIRPKGKDKRGKGYQLHRMLYCAVLASYTMFLWVTYSLAGNVWLNYAVLAYFLFVIPISRKVNITIHAVLASIGLVLLIGVATFNVL